MFWVIGTFAGVFLSIIMGLITISLWVFMHDEGRFFFKRNFDKRGIDVIRHEPLSNRLRLITVKWNGKYFQYGKEMMYFGIESLINPDTDTKRYYNEVISRMCSWADSRRPVLIATDISSHLITPDHLALITKSRKHEEYKTAQKLIPKRFKLPDDHKNPELVTYLETIKPDDLTEFMEDIGSRDMFETYFTGKRVAELERAKGIELSGAAKIAISLAGIGLVALIIYMVATGRLQEIFQTMST